MMNDDTRFAAFILTRGRPDNVITFRTLLRAGYTGPIYFIVDKNDETISKYEEVFGANTIKVVDAHGSLTEKRNACFDVAEGLGLTHFMQLDDDYYYFGYRFDTGARKIRNLDRVFEILVNFYDRTPITSIAFAQGGDHIGGFSGIKLKRKAMNSFLCSPSRRFSFLGNVNEDVNAYTRLGSVGNIFFTFTGLQLDQKDTQSQRGGFTNAYLSNGTYVKSFTSVIYSPSSVRIIMMQSEYKRLHHSVNWKTAIPMIVPAPERETKAMRGSVRGANTAPARSGGTRD